MVENDYALGNLTKKCCNFVYKNRQKQVTCIKEKLKNSQQGSLLIIYEFILQNYKFSYKNAVRKFSLTYIFEHI